MTSQRSLALHEAVLLLALHDEKGTVQASMFAYAAAGALLAELLERGALRVRTRRGRRLLEVADPAPAGDPLLDECLARVAAAKRAAALSNWVERFAGIRSLKDRVAEGLCQRGVLRRVEGRVLWVFRRETYPTSDPGPERRLVAALRLAVEADGPVGEDTAVVLALADAAAMLPRVLDRSLLRARRKRLGALVKQAEATLPMGDAVAAARSAISNAEAAAAAVTAGTV